MTRAALLLPILGRLAACAPASTDTADSDTATPHTLTVVTFNTGTTEGVITEEPPAGGYGSAQATWSDLYYGDGLAWQAAVDATTTFLAAVDPDVVVFQEIFWSEECVDVPAEAREGFVCATWTAGEPTVAQAVLGEGWQVACHPGHPDKCAAVHERVGRFAGCDDDLCIEGLAGSTIEGCGNGARVGRGMIEPADGGEPWTLVNVHGSSGLDTESKACRVAQVEQVFIDVGDGAPAANGTANLVMGDLNTDPGRFADFDASAARWNDFVGGEQPFRWITQVGADAPGSYGGVADIDHVVSDTWTGACEIAGLDEALPEVFAPDYFDHRPVVCRLVR